MLVVMIATISVWFTACSKDDKPDEDYLKSKIIGKKWYCYNLNPEDYISFREDGTFTCKVEATAFGGIYYDGMNINGMYSIREIEETELDGKKTTLFKMLASGSNDFDQLWVYHFINRTDIIGISTYYIAVSFYSGNEFFRGLAFSDNAGGF